MRKWSVHEKGVVCISPIFRSLYQIQWLLSLMPRARNEWGQAHGCHEGNENLSCPFLWGSSINIPGPQTLETPLPPPRPNQTKSAPVVKLLGSRGGVGVGGYTQQKSKLASVPQHQVKTFKTWGVYYAQVIWQGWFSDKPEAPSWRYKNYLDLPWS